MSPAGPPATTAVADRPHGPARGLVPRAGRLRADLDHLATLTEPGPGVTRLAFTELERAAHRYAAEQLTALGARVRTDVVGNTIAELPGSVPGAPAIGSGSHLDSVPSGGRFDGIAGVVAAVEVARLLTESGTELRHPYRVVVFAAEEGARFGQACTGSRIVAGLTDSADLDRLTDHEGTTMAEAMRSVGLAPDRAAEARWDPADWLAFLELHIEQGSVLESSDLPLGVVDVISGSTRLEITLSGVASHTGGTPMHLRSDALAAAAELVLAAESLAWDSRHHGTRATVGRLEVLPGALTTIPGTVVLGVDVRDVDSARQRATVREFLDHAAGVAVRRGVGFRHRLLADTSPVVLPAALRAQLVGAAERSGTAYRVMPSGASHDSQMVNRVVPAGMLFVPSRDGLSHTPAEWTSVEQIAEGTAVLAEAVVGMDAAGRLGPESAADGGS
ncbi:hydantoinase/carbamoylase family amidase [Actinoalloteichus hoggarensis]|uniref:Putative hydrolase n=1 Tax=Actinoalloteichus hoggarensis TaxID=1470176 RepID=A0A221W8Y8_9PSEU|nr:Zn-dependent hydrolase [Actinoalloteichus hoggarensis]ASO21999.1 putative hydrolase [Actinoalloteichus hoggarensis]MBB5923921.1 hydantoinase/carbamoylase family amidase [Actinoalloteichus hoggarensis]